MGSLPDPASTAAPAARPPSPHVGCKEVQYQYDYLHFVISSPFALFRCGAEYVGLCLPGDPPESRHPSSSGGDGATNAGMGSCPVRPGGRKCEWACTCVFSALRPEGRGFNRSQILDELWRCSEPGARGGADRYAHERGSAQRQQQNMGFMGPASAAPFCILHGMPWACIRILP